MAKINNTATGQAGAASLTFSLVINAGPKKALYVCVATEFSGVSINSVTYKGQALTRKVQDVNNNEVRAEIWELINPPVGTANVVITCSALSNIIGMAVCLNNVNQQSSINAAGSSNGASGNASLNISPTKGNSFILDCLSSGEAGGSITKEAGQTLIYDNESTPFDAGSSYKLINAGPTTMSWTISGGARWAHVAVAITPSSGGMLMSGSI